MIKRLKIKGLDCANCAQKLEDRINKKVDDVKVQINFFTQKILIETEADFDKKLQEIRAMANKYEPEVEIS